MKKTITLIALICFALISKAQTFSWSGFAPIYDFQTDTIPINVSGLPAVIDTNFGIAHVCMYITHTYDADLLIKLVSPNGASVTLIQSVGGSGDNFTGTCLGMDGTAFSNAQPPYTGLFLPTGNVSSFNNGQNPNGQWLFIVTDQAGADTGSIHSVSLAFTNNPPRQQTTGGGGSGGGPTGVYVCSTCVCPGGAASCDLLPDMTASGKEILTNHNETPGFLYISNATPNIGYGPIDIYGIDSCFCGTTYVPCNTICPNGVEIKHIVKQRIYHKVAGNDTLTYYDRFAGAMTYHPTHGHLHVDNWASYTLRTRTSNPDARTWPIVSTGVKQSFCLVNLGTCGGNNGECVSDTGTIITTVPNQNLGFHTGCGLTQGIYPGNYDVYSISLNDPIPLNGVCNGDYYIVSITDPNNDFLESNENNNWVAVPITLTQQGGGIPIITSNASSSTICPGGSITLSSSTATNYRWSSGATTKSITVNAPGIFTVTTDTSATCSGTSLPYTVSYTVMNITPSSPQVCRGDSVQLIASTTNEVQNNYTVGNGTIVNSGTGYPAPYGNYYWGARHQFLIRASELTAAGMSAGILTGLSFDVSTVNSAPVHNNFIIRMGSTSLDSISTFQSGLTTVKTSNNYQPVAGWNKHDFTSPFNWNGTSNIIVETCFNNSSWVNNGNASVRQSTTAFRSTVYYRADAGSVCGTNSVTATASQRPNIRFTRFVPLTYSWSPTVGLNNPSIANPIAKPSNTTLYTVTSNNQCNTTGQVTVTVTNCNSLITLNLKVFIEGYYLGGDSMVPVVDPVNRPLVCDTVTIHLVDSVNLNAIAATAKSPISIHGYGTFTISASALLPGHKYYLIVRNRNAVETWSKNALSFEGSTVTFDFTIPN